MKKLLWLALPPLLIAGCNRTTEPADGTNQVSGGATNATPSQNDAAPAVPAADTPGYLAKAGAGDLFEIESSEAIIAKTKNAEIRSFAQMMIKHHKESTAKVTAAAKQAGISVAAPALEPHQQQSLDEIKKATGADADRVYLDAQVTAHDQALALHQAYAANGDTPQLKTAAGEIATVVQRHIETLARLRTP